MMNKISQRLSDNASLISNKLSELLSLCNCDERYSILSDSVCYSTMSGGKRLRSYLTLEFCRMLGGNDESALVFGSAVEFIHTYSLIHDDLPSMDNDDLRRGKPTNHKIFGEATALLSGDALLTLAFETICKNDCVSPSIIVKAVSALAACAGINGMVGGQQLDLIGEETEYGLETLEYMQSLKTGKLIEAACVLGCYAAGNDDIGVIEAAQKYAEGVGRAFQIVDDVLDVTGDEAILGKPIGSDASNSKTTFMSYMSVDEAKTQACLRTEQACKAIYGFVGSEILIDTAEFLLDRKN